MKAAVVTDRNAPPTWSAFAEPTVTDGEAIVTVEAAALSPLTRAIASGKHYSSAATENFVAGIDGVGRLDGGRRVYFAFPRAPFGAMAERAPVLDAHYADLPSGVDLVTAAAIANPGMSSWVALAERARFQRGESVLINGATGVAGQLAIQIAKHLGAKYIVATGRRGEQLARLRELGVDHVLTLSEPEPELTASFRKALHDFHVDVVLDYLWGEPAKLLFAAIAQSHRDDDRRLRFVQIGSIAGAQISFDSSVLRSTNLEVLGSGLGSVTQPRLVACIGDLMRAIDPAGLHLETETRRFEEVGEAWNIETGSRRLVFTK